MSIRTGVSRQKGLNVPAVEIQTLENLQEDFRRQAGRLLEKVECPNP